MGKRIISLRVNKYSKQDCFTTLKVIYVTYLYWKCVSITNISYRALHGRCYYIITKTNTSKKRLTKLLWKIAWSNFSIFYTKILHDKILLFDAALSFQKHMTRADMLNEVLNNYGQIIFLGKDFICSFNFLFHRRS